MKDRVSTPNVWSSSRTDWAALRPLGPTEGHHAGQIRCLELIGEAVGNDTPFIQTIFSPLSQARYLAGQARLTIHLRQAPEQVKPALEMFTERTIGFIQAAKATGLAGIYYAVQMANYGDLSEAEYRAFGEPYDRRILAAAGDLPFNLVHLHGADAMFDLVAAYPASALNWHDREAGPSLAEGQQRFPGAVSGGLEHWDDLLYGDPDRVAGQGRGRHSANGRPAASHLIRLRRAGERAIQQSARGAAGGGT